jgi:hypothetical protein
VPLGAIYSVPLIDSSALRVSIDGACTDPHFVERYLIASDHEMLGAIAFGASAWKVAAREAHLGRVLNNARLLLLPKMVA